MPPRRRAAPALDVDVLRTGLAAGRLVRVSIAPSGQFPDGATGRVRSIGDPTTDGDEYLLIEVGTGSAKDVLPFAPGDLLPYSRNGRAAAAAAVPPAAERRVPVKRATRPRTSPPKPMATPPAPAEPATPPEPAVSVGPTGPESDGLFDTGSPVKQSPGRGRSGRSGAGSAAGVAGSSARGRRPAVTITVGSDDQGSWTVQAKVGAKVAVRSRPVSPARVAEIARQLGEPALIAAVDRLLEDNRRVVQARAQALADELAKVQAELDSYLA